MEYSDVREMGIFGELLKNTHFPDIRGLHLSKIWIDDLLSTTLMASKIMENENFCQKVARVPKPTIKDSLN